MSGPDHDHDFESELDATLAAMTGVTHVEAGSRARVLEALERDRSWFAGFAWPRLGAVAVGIVVLVAVAAGSLWIGSSLDEASPRAPLAAERRIGPTMQPAPSVVGMRTGQVSATALAPARAGQRARPWVAWEGELPPLVVPPLERPDAIAAEQLTIDEVALSPIEIAAIEIEAVDASPTPAPHP